MDSQGVKTVDDLWTFFQELSYENYQNESGGAYEKSEDGWKSTWTDLDSTNLTYSNIRDVVRVMSNRSENPWTEERILESLETKFKEKRFSKDYEIFQTFLEDRSKTTTPIADPPERIQWLGTTADFFRLVNYLEENSLIPTKNRARFSRFFLDKNGNPMPQDASPFTARMDMLPDPQTKKLIDDMSKKKS